MVKPLLRFWVQERLFLCPDRWVLSKSILLSVKSSFAICLRTFCHRHSFNFKQGRIMRIYRFDCSKAVYQASFLLAALVATPNLLAQNAPGVIPPSQNAPTQNVEAENNAVVEAERSQEAEAEIEIKGNRK